MNNRIYINVDSLEGLASGQIKHLKKQLEPEQTNRAIKVLRIKLDYAELILVRFTCYSPKLFA